MEISHNSTTLWQHHPNRLVFIRQATVETATYGSEFVAAKTATEQIVDLRNTLWYLGVPIMNKAYMFGDNNSVVMSSTIPQSIINKRHNRLSYHRVREAIVTEFQPQRAFSNPNPNG